MTGQFGTEKFDPTNLSKWPPLIYYPLTADTGHLRTMLPAFTGGIWLLRMEFSIKKATIDRKKLGGGILFSIEGGEFGANSRSICGIQISFGPKGQK